MTNLTVTGYPLDGFDDSDESFELLLDGAATGPDTGYGPEPRTLASGRCTLCEADTAELVPWAGERLCWTCTDLQLDLLARAVMEAGAVPVTLAVR
jgi:hypothetical protein